MDMTETPIYHAGYVAVVGRPNVGKSTLINNLLGQKIAAVSPRAQTTRRRQLGILTLENAQAVFIDTPGLHLPHHKLGEYMNNEAVEALQNTDVIVWMVDINEPPTEEDRLVAVRLAGLRRRPRTVLALNKVDKLAAEALPERIAEYQALLPQAEPVAFSATGGQGRDELLQMVLARLPQGERIFDEDQITDLYEREIAVELIREAALLHLRDEVPHALAVRLDEFSERENGSAFIRAMLLVEKVSHKGIVIGQGGEMLKRIGSTARKQIEDMSGRKVFLEIRVKVSEDWRNNPDQLRHLGYRR
jgi:GTP-binding protein Era